MKLKYFSIALDSDDYLMPNEPGAEFPFSVSPIVSDFSFQTFYISEFIQQRLMKEKFEVSNYDRITIRGRRKTEIKLVFKEHLKSLNIEIPFDEKKYKELYPFENTYPLKGLIKPIENVEAFSDFLISMIVAGMIKAKEEKVSFPSDFIVDTALDFKVTDYKNEWVHKVRLFKEYGLKTILLCKLTPNYFSLELIVEKSNQEIFRKEILKTLPSEIQYGDEFNDIEIQEGKIFITKDIQETTPLFTLPLSKL